MLARRIVLTLGLALSSAAIGCGGSDGGGSTGVTSVLTSVTVAPANPAITVGATVTMAATPLDQNAAAMSGLAGATFTSSDPSKATVGATSGVVTGVAAGTSSITATIVSGSISKSGSQTVTVGAIPTTATVTGTSSNTWDPATANVAAAGTVQWVLNGNHSVIFDTAPAGGTVPSNIDITATGAAAQRTLAVAGNYGYHCGVHGSAMSGTIVVH